MNTLRHIIICLSLFLSIIPYKVLCQDSLLRKNTVYVEYGCLTYFLSANYERTIFSNNNLMINAHAGIGFEPTESNLIEILGIKGASPNYFEFGLGSNAKWYKVRLDNSMEINEYYRILFLTRIGYRYQNNNNGLFFRLSFTLECFKYENIQLIDNGNMYKKGFNKVLVPVSGFAIGYCF